MSLSLATVEEDFKNAVAQAVTYVDLADKVADNLAVYAAAVPQVAPEVAEAVKLLDDFTKALNAVNTALNAS